MVYTSPQSYSYTPSSAEIMNDYVIGNTLGTGTFSCVKAAEHVKTKEAVAVKIAKRNVNMNHLLNEVAIGKKLGSHPNVGRFMESFTHQGRMCLVFERIEGSDLFAVLDESSGAGICDRLMRRLFSQVVQGLHYAHQLGIVHRDIKPENILVDMSRYTVKIIDWGLSAMVKPDQLLTTHVGSVEYCAPEILLAKPYDGFKADCWSLGVLLYVCLTSLFPWEGNSHKDVVQNIIKAKYVPPHNGSVQARDLIDRLLTVEPKSRFDTNDILKHPWLEMHKLELSSF